MTILFARRLRPSLPGLLPLALGLGACFLKPTEPEKTTRVDLLNRLYLAGEWEWSDTVAYAEYVPATDTVPHRGVYVVSGTATLEEVDSTDVETYAMTAVSEVMHVDSAGDAEVMSWRVPNIEFADTVRVENDTIFGLEVEPIPPTASPTTDGVRWVLQANQLWCTNWLTDTLPAGNAQNCRTVISWRRTAGTGSDTTASDTTSP